MFLMLGDPVYRMSYFNLLGQTTHQVRVDILLVPGECHKNYNALRLYAEYYPDRRHSNPQQVINIERRSQNPLHRQRQQNRDINNNDQRFIAILAMVHLNPHVNLR